MFDKGVGCPLLSRARRKLPMSSRVGMDMCKHLVDLYVVACWLCCFICCCMLVALQLQTCFASIKYCKCVVNNANATVLATWFIMHLQYLIDV